MKFSGVGLTPENTEKPPRQALAIAPVTRREATTALDKPSLRGFAQPCAAPVPGDCHHGGTLTRLDGRQFEA